MFSLHIDTARSWRGGQNQVLLTVVGLRSRGHRAALVAHSQGELSQRARKGPDLFPLALNSEIDFHGAWKLSQLIRQLRPDLVHAHDARSITITALALSLSRLEPRPCFVAARRVDFHVGKHAFSRWKYRQVECFICASDFIRSMLIEDGVLAKRTTVVHDGIDLKNVSAAPTVNLHKKFGLPHHALIVGNVAALVPHKGQRYLVEAAALALQEVPDARFLIVGEGKLKDALRRQIKKLSLENRVILTGFRPDVLSLHKGFDLFVMSSVTEGLGTSVLDAMACGRSVVATRAGGLPEAIEHNKTGLLVPARDSVALAKAITQLLGNATQRERYAKAGLERTRQRFSADRMVDEIVKVYARVGGIDHAADTAYHHGSD